MQDRISPSGHVKIEIIKANGSKKDQDGPNTISSELKNKLANALINATSNFGVMNTPFTADDFSAPTNGKSGIYIKDSNDNVYQMLTTLDSTSAKSFVIKGVIRASQAYTISDGYLGHDYQTNTFTVDYSAYDFNPDISLADGDQLNVTWTLTIDD